MGSLRAAADKIDITPDPKNPVKLLGWDKGIYTRPGVGAASPLYARALLLEKDGVKALIVSLDVCWATESDVILPPDRLFDRTLPEKARESWAKAAGVAPTGLTVHATHTHTAPALSSGAAQDVETMIAQLPSRLQEVSLRAGARDCPLAVYRAVRSDTWANDFLINRRLTVLELIAGDTPVARLVGFGVHPLLFQEKDRIHPDFVGAGMAELDLRRRGTSLYIQGFSGDLGPNVNGHYKGGALDAAGVKAYGEKLAAAVGQTLAEGRAVAVDTLKVASGQASLPTREGKTYPVGIHAIAFGKDALLLSVAAEVFNDYGAMVKNYYCPSYRYVLTSGVANGYWGYLPSAAAFQRTAEVEYEVATSPFVPEAQQRLLDSLASLVRGL